MNCGRLRGREGIGSPCPERHRFNSAWNATCLCRSEAIDIDAITRILEGAASYTEFRRWIREASKGGELKRVGQSGLAQAVCDLIHRISGDNIFDTLTSDNNFTDNLLYLLLESQR
ncbi:MAG: hypothetical protein VCD00_13005 [Candidatus Hydrogenedentota bacterium]